MTTISKRKEGMPVTVAEARAVIEQIKEDAKVGRMIDDQYWPFVIEGLCRDAEQGRKIAEIANKHGWGNGDHSKILSEFIKAELKELKRYRKMWGDLITQQRAMIRRLASNGKLSIGF